MLHKIVVWGACVVLKDVKFGKVADWFYSVFYAYKEMSKELLWCAIMVYASFICWLNIPLLGLPQLSNR